MTYAVLDLETTIKESFKRKANPFDHDNRIVLFGYKKSDSTFGISEKVDFDFLSSIKTIVGHNIKFDLLYLWDYPRLQEWLKNGGRIFDTIVAEYILQAQKPDSLALDDLAPKYGGSRKNRISALIKAGKCTSYLYKKYPKSMRKYLEGDLLNTEIVMLAQLKLLKKEGQLNLAKALMDSVLAITEMEFNGLYINQYIHGLLRNQIRFEIREKLAALENEVTKIWPPISVAFNPASNDHISLLFFGGELKYKMHQKIIDGSGNHVVYKTGNKKGQFKYKLYNGVQNLTGLISTNKLTRPVKKLGFYKVDDSVISKIATKKGKAAKTAQLLLEYRALKKEQSTYYEAFGELIQSDGCIHGSLNQCVTDTGRLASSKPNIQNLPRKGTSHFKKIFTSRFEEAGMIMEADMKQLEVVAAAFLSNDVLLKEEIKSGVDLHYTNAEWVYKKPKEQITDDERTLVKRQTFQLLYGATPYGLAKSVGCSEEEARLFINGFYTKYKGVADWHKKLEYDVYRSAKVPENGNFRSSIYKNITGRKLKFTEVQRKNGSIEFNLPDIKNYPVQSFATGDIVPIQLGRLYRALLPYRDKVLLINTVHDSVLLDCKKKFAYETCKILKSVLEYSRWMKEIWNIDFDLPLKVDIKIGNNWYDLIDYNEYFKQNQDLITE